MLHHWLRYPILLMLSFFLLVSLKNAARAESETSGIAPGTVITMQNWRQYNQFMTSGIQALFEGQYFWKLPADIQIPVGPTHHYPVSKTFEQLTDQYSKDVKITQLPDGGHVITGYVGGYPFPNPSEPYKGWKILVNLWYAYFPFLWCAPHAHLYFEDRFGNLSSEEFVEISRKLSHAADAGQPITNPESRGYEWALYLEVTSPEEARYTAELELKFVDMTREDDFFLFIPSLRRTLRLSGAARCSPVIGSDYTQDDGSHLLFNGELSKFEGQFLRDQPILNLMEWKDAKLYGSLSSYYQPLLFPKPVLGNWEVRNARVIDVRRIPALRTGYCYGKRVIYVDAENYFNMGEEVYDSDMRLWKICVNSEFPGFMPGAGLLANSANEWANFWDVQNVHQSMYVSTDPEGHDGKNGSDCRNYEGVDYDNVGRYSSVRGLNEILR